MVSYDRYKVHDVVVYIMVYDMKLKMNIAACNLVQWIVKSAYEVTTIM